MCIFHKWETVEQYKGTGTKVLYNAFTGSTYKEKTDVLGVIEKCSKCNKERGFAEFPNGERLKQTPWSIRHRVTE